MITNERIGTALAITGTIISAIASFINSVLLLHILAMQIWFFSNPLILVYFIGLRYRKWNGSLSFDAMIVLYVFYVITNGYGLIIS